ncbi:MAG: class I SAM-dependent methyltransferase [Chloroflexi bacterium]|nr:class I SAM-dependent methyltransferase [Chloroflexota bacterium]
MSTNKLSRDVTRRRFERDAASFDAIYRVERSPFWRVINKTLRKGIFLRYDITFEQAGDVTGQAILDVGCGSGVYCVDFARRGAARVVGIDFSSNMLDIARQEARREGVAQTCDFILGDFMELELDECFDVTIAMGVFDYQPDPLPFLRKMVAATRGKVIVSFPGHSLVRQRLRTLRYALSGKGGVYFYSEAEVRALARESGLREVTIIPIRVSGSGFVLVGTP